MWESSVDLVRFMREQPQHSSLALGPSHAVLELGCGHGLPGIHAAQQGACGAFLGLGCQFCLSTPTYYAKHIYPR